MNKQRELAEDSKFFYLKALSLICFCNYDNVMKLYTEFFYVFKSEYYAEMGSVYVTYIYSILLKLAYKHAFSTSYKYT